MLSFSGTGFHIINRLEEIVRGKFELIQNLIRFLVKSHGIDDLLEPILGSPGSMLCPFSIEGRRVINSDQIPAAASLQSLALVDPSAGGSPDQVIAGWPETTPFGPAALNATWCSDSTNDAPNPGVHAPASQHGRWSRPATTASTSRLTTPDGDKPPASTSAFAIAAP
jgi:hypothetical protein